MRRTIVSLIAGAALVLAPIAASAEGVPVIAPSSTTTQKAATGPLTPAAPAGVQQAQGSTRGPGTILLGGAAALLGGVLALAGGSRGGNGPAPTTSSTGSGP